MPTRNINLTERYDQFVDELVISGRFSNASEVMRAGLRLLEEQAREEEEKLKFLRGLASEGFGELDQGQGIALDDDQQLAEFIGQIGRHAAREVEHRTSGG
jgi:antitoxin ParD1/3/4